MSATLDKKAIAFDTVPEVVRSSESLSNQFGNEAEETFPEGNLR